MGYSFGHVATCEGGDESGSGMAITQNTNRRKVRKQWFYKRKGFWLTLLLLGLVAGSRAGCLRKPTPANTASARQTYDLDRINDLEIPSLIVDRNGKEIGRIFVQNRSVIPIDKVPEIFINALRAGEDSRFLNHTGRRLHRHRARRETHGARQRAGRQHHHPATRAQCLQSQGRGGAARMKPPSSARLVEAFLAMRIEKRYTKPEILEFYLNRIYFGSGFYGIRSASLGYFGKEPMDLTR